MPQRSEGPAADDGRQQAMGRGYADQWIEPLAELEQRRAAGRGPGAEHRVQRQHDRGKLTARERIDRLFDPGTFEEYGVLAASVLETPGRDPEPIPADGVVVGYGEIDGRRVYVVADDATAPGGGARGAAAYAKVERIQDLAKAARCPLVSLLESSAARIQDQLGSQFADARGSFGREVAASGVIPRVVALMGGGFGQPSFLAMLSDFRPIVKGTGFMGMSGPPVVEAATGEKITPETLGGSGLQSATTGHADLEVEDDEACLAAIREFLGFFPSSCHEAPPRRPTEDPPTRQVDELLELVPVNLRRAYDVRKVARAIVDDGVIFEMKPAYARNIVTALARLGGRTVGIIANQPMFLAGSIDRPAAQKATRFTELCDSFHIPLVFLQDVPGFFVGTQVEEDKLLTEGIRWMQALCEATVPKLTVVTRKGYGLAHFAMGGRGIDPDVLLAWPSASIGMMGPDAGVNVVYARELSQSEDRAALEQELTSSFLDAAAPYLAAEMAALDDVIDPRDTRRQLISALEAADAKVAGQLGYKHGIGP